MSIVGLSMAALPCCAEEDVEAGSAALRVDWPVYPRRAEHNTVAEGGNRRWAEIARQNAFQSRWPRPTRGTPAKASAEIDVAAVTVEGNPQTGSERPRAPHQAACEPPSALSGGDEGVEASGASGGPPAKIGRVILAPPAAVAK